MEGSKAFAKEFMCKHKIPTAQFRVFQSNQYEQAVEYVRSCAHRVVLKADGLAAGKGVLLPESLEETLQGLEYIMKANAFGEAGLSFDRTRSAEG